MLTDQHPITPPPELVREWNQNAIGTHFRPYGYSECIATQAARWGADQELEACVKWMLIHLHAGSNLSRQLRAARRPKPPSLAEQALKALQDQIDTSFKLSSKAQERVDLICAALKRLQELESNG